MLKREVDLQHIVLTLKMEKVEKDKQNLTKKNYNSSKIPSYKLVMVESKLQDKKLRRR